MKSNFILCLNFANLNMFSVDSSQMRWYTEIEFEDLTDDDKGTFRKSCAAAGVLPTFDLGEKHARGMLATAAENNSCQKYSRY